MPPTEESFRRQPKQERSEFRVEQLLEAAAKAMASSGVASTTIAMIAEEAKTSIGTVYQYFPNKAAVVHALRNRFGKGMEERLAELRTTAAQLSCHEIAAHLVQVCCEFADGHPAYFHVFEMTQEGQRDEASKDRLRTQLAEVLRTKQPALSRQKAVEIAEVFTQLLKSMPPLYLVSKPARRRSIASDYTLVLEAYLTARLHGISPD